MRRFTTLKGCRSCGRNMVAPQVGLRLSSGRAGYSGLATCASVWACSVCNAKIMARRAIEISAAVALAEAQGLSVGMATFTMRHHQGQSLKSLWAAVSGAWNAANQNRGPRSAKEAAEVVAWLRVVEVTHGVNGWHVHIHALVFLRSPDRFGSLFSAMFDSWSMHLVAKGFGAPLLRGQDWQLVNGPADDALAQYFAKATDDHGWERIGLELSWSQSKQARTVLSTRTPWELLTDVIEDGDADSLDLWHEWERASFRKKQRQLSYGFAKLLGVGSLLDDEEIVSQELGTADDTILWLTRESWACLVSCPTLIPELLTAAETLGFKGAAALLDRAGVPYIGGK